jgi:serine/threonine-protein kinase
LWSFELASGRRSRLTFDGLSTFPVWDPSGRRLVLSSGQSGKYQILIRSFGESAADTPVLSERGTNYPLSWSPDGRFIATVSVETDTANDIWILTPDASPAWQSFVKTRYREGAPTFSHDARLIAYASDQSGRSEIYVKPFPAGEAVTVSTDGGTEPLFARGAPTLFYRKGDDMLAVEIAAGPPIAIGTPRRVFSKPYNRSNGFWPNFDVTSDGRRLIMIRGTAQEVPSHVNVVLNWLEQPATK